MIPEQEISSVRADNKSSPAGQSACFNEELKMQGGQNAMIKRETADTIPLPHVTLTLHLYRLSLVKASCF